MKKEEFEESINSNKYQVFVMCCPAHFPFVFAVHPWFVYNQGTVFNHPFYCNFIFLVKFYKNFLELTLVSPSKIV
jgi:hypothetical protein